MERRKILVAAQRDILEATKHSFFQRVHYDLLVVYNGEEAFAAIEAQDPVLVILSLDMPEFPGDACCRRVKNDRLLQKTPIILVAPPVSDESQERCHQSGCDAVVLTPLEPQELVTTACRFLGIGKRIEHRTPVDLATHYGPLSGDTFPGRVVDLTSGGVFISATKLLPIDTRITVEFALPGESEETRYLGRVSWVNHPEWMKTSRRHFGMGVQFLDLPPERRTAILQYLAELDRNKVETLASGDEG